MPPLSKGATYAAGAVPETSGANNSNPWIQVSWMPHTSLSQTSYVKLTLRTAFDRQEEEGQRTTAESNNEWRVRAAVYGMAGTPLGLSTETSAAPLCPIVEGVKQQQQAANNPSLILIDGGCTYSCVWEETIRLPVRWRDLPRDAYLRLDILGPTDEMIAWSTISFFTPYGKLKTGLHRSPLTSVQSEEATSWNEGLEPLKPRSERLAGEAYDPLWKASCTLDQLSRFENQTRKATITPGAPSSAGAPSTSLRNPAFALDQIRSVPWLDALQRERCQNVLSEAIQQAQTTTTMPTGYDTITTSIDDEKAQPRGWIVLDFPLFEIPILHEETFYPTPTQGASGTVAPLDLVVHHKRGKPAVNHPSLAEEHNPLDLVAFLDYENEEDNPVEDKYRTLAHDLLRGLVDPALKPDRKQREQLAAIIESPSKHPTREEKDLLWRFRFSLVDNRKALTKFLLAVDWTVDSEVVQAAELLEQWRKRSPIEVTDALKLLGKNVAFQTSLVRSYAIDTLAAAPDSELRLYLLQLVQALKYENLDGPGETKGSSLANFLVQRAAQNFELANFLYWYLKVELQNPTYGARYRDMFTLLESRLSETEFRVNRQSAKQSTPNMDESHSSITPFKSIVDSVSKLGSTFRQSDSEGQRKHTRRTVWDALVAQDKYISGIMDVQLRCRDSRGKRDAKEGQLKTLLGKEGFDRTMNGEVIPLPSTPKILVNGLRPDTAKMFKSALYPALIEFRVDRVLAESDNDREDSSYKVIVKTGDDLRQDQLIIMMIQLMDGLLKHAALDLCLTPYSVIAMSPSSGLVEFIDGAVPISMILGQYNNSILSFFQEKASEKGAKYDVKPSVLSTYVRSCAGYCVLTYLLGVGDRHLDNILLRATGHFFHIDFGFVFGRDPKPLPPAFRLTREMVDGMGGVDSPNYKQFISLACQAFNVLRRSAGLVLNLLHLMSDAGIEDLSNNPSADVDGVIARVEERFRLDLNDEQAERYFTGLINDCLSAIAPRVMEIFHSFSVARR